MTYYYTAAFIWPVAGLSEARGRRHCLSPVAGQSRPGSSAS